MLIELSITNYRSIREKATLSMIADRYDSKTDNVIEYSLPNNKEIRLLNTVLIFGSNGSGKSTLMQAIAGAIPTNEGKIYYQQNDINIDEENWHKMLSFSSPYFFNS